MRQPFAIGLQDGSLFAFAGLWETWKADAVIRTRAAWQNAACAARLALNTTLRGREIRQLRWCDVDMIGRSLTVRKSKTEAEERLIPLNADAWTVILELYGRSRGLKSFGPSHFLFPACENAHIDPTQPVKSWRTAWRRLTRAIQCAQCGLLQDPAEVCSSCGADTSKLKSPFKCFRFHDTRHQAITEHAESKASDRTIMEIAGHASKKMLKHYSHIRLEARRNALDALNMKPELKVNLGSTGESYDTTTQIPAGR